MSKAIGIDLGTTHSVAAVKRLEAEIIANSQGDLLTPSVVACQTEKGLFDKKKKFIVGREALDWMAQDPGNTILSVKRLMGRSFSDREVSKLIEEKRFAYTIRPLTGGSEHSLAVVLNHEEYTPEQISARILEKIKADAELGIKGDADHAVVTVPAYFNDKQKNATRMAATLAGIKVQRLLSEPTAAAISFGIDTMAEGEGQTILVFDLGGGTFDIAVLTISEGQFIEQGKGGDMWMGGDDIDALITRYVFSETEKTQCVEDLPKRVEALPAADKNRFLSDLKRKVEAAKIQLSTQNKAVIEILGLLTDEDGDILDVEVELTRAQFETLLLPFAERTVELTRQMIEAIDFDLDLIDKIVMVGGASCIPLVINKMKAAFGEKRVLTHPRPMLAIAEGAAILAHRLSDSYECPGCGKTVAQADTVCKACDFDLNAMLAKTGVVDIVYTVSHDYTLALEDGSAYLLVEKNTPLPFKTEAAFKLMHPEQRLAHFKFHNRVNEIQESIGDLWLSFDPNEHEEHASEHDHKDILREILLTFEIDENNIITVAASLKDLPDVKVSKTLSRGNIDEKLFMDLEASITQVNREKHDFYVVLDFLQRTIGIAKEINQVLDPKTGEVDETTRKQVRHRQSVAKQLLSEESSAFSNLYYAEAFMLEVGIFLSDAEQRAMQKKIDKLKEKNTSGSVDDILKARDALLKELDKYPALIQIKNIEAAAEILSEKSPAKAPRFLKYLEDIKSALMRNDKETFFRLMNEIMPEVHHILDDYESKGLRIWKEIRQ